MPMKKMPDVTVGLAVVTTVVGDTTHEIQRRTQYECGILFSIDINP